MKNEKGITLIELIAALAIVGVVLALIGGVLINGLNASKRSETNQRLQQEANYITESVRNKFLEKPKDEEKIVLKIEDNQLILIEKNLADEVISDRVISEGYEYELKNKATGMPMTEMPVERNNSKQDFYIKLTKNTLSYDVDTTFTKLK